MNPTNSLILVLMSAGLLFFVGKPFWAGVSFLREEKGVYLEQIEKIKALEEKKDELLAKINNVPEEERQKIETFLPSEDMAIRLIADIDGIASRHGISLESVDTRPSNNPIQSIVEAGTSKPYDSKLVSMSFSASYANLTKFIIDLEQSLRLLDIKAIDIAEASKEAGASNLYNYKVDAEIYWLKDMASEKII